MTDEEEYPLLVKAFHQGDVATFKALLPHVDLSDKNITNLFKVLFNAEKYFEQKEMLNMIKEVQ